MVKLAAKAMKEPRPIWGLPCGSTATSGFPGFRHRPIPPTRSFSSFDFKPLSRIMPNKQKDARQSEHEEWRGRSRGELRLGFNLPVAGFSVAHSWTETTNTLLPKTDVVVFLRIGGEPVMVEWENVVDAAGDLMEAVDIYPPRFRVREFPTEKQLAAMGNMLKET